MKQEKDYRKFRNCFEFLQKVFLVLMHSFSCVLLSDFLVLSASVLRQIARYLPHHRSENASKTHPKSSYFLSGDSIRGRSEQTR